jgi:hypothetical protein
MADTRALLFYQIQESNVNFAFIMLLRFHITCLAKRLLCPWLRTRGSFGSSWFSEATSFLCQNVLLYKMCGNTLLRVKQT